MDWETNSNIKPELNLALFWVHALQNNCVTTKQTTYDLKSEIEATVNRCLEAMDPKTTKLYVLGVKLQVNEVK